MKVFHVISHACRINGGAALAARFALGSLRHVYGFECELLSLHPVPFSRTDDGIGLRGFCDVEDLKAIVGAERPDVIMASLADSVPAFQVARRFRVPGILCIHGYEFSPPTEEERRRWSIPDLDRPLSVDDIAFVLNAADHVFTCSTHMQAFLLNRSGRASEVLHNEWGADAGDVIIAPDIRDASHITAVCGYPHKGADILVELARRFPQQRFMLVGEPGSDLPVSMLNKVAKLRNVELPGRMRPRDFLARSKLVLVPSQWPEPFGRIAVEALANAIPILASRSGGLKELVGDGPMGVDEFMDIDAWERGLRAAIDDQLITPADIQDGLQRARGIMSAEPVHLLARTIRELAHSAAPDWTTRRIGISGGIGGVEAHTLDNAEWSRELTRRGFAVRPIEEDRYALHDSVLFHDYSRNFNEFVPPPAGHFIAVRTSDFGPYPRSWVSKIEAECDQLWVYSEWIKQQARASGIDPELTRVVPPGIDPDIFRPDGPTSPLVPRDSFSFLFVGGAVRRKGIDLLIKAYQSAFAATDRAMLVIKGDSQNMFYKGRSEVESILGTNGRAGGPALLHIDRHLTIEELAALYRSCDVGVFPYRAEGFAKPILEAMASGMPSIVPNIGPAVDYCSPATSFLVAARRIRLPFSRTVSLALGFEMDVESVDLCEVRVDALARAMREVYDAGRDSLHGRRQAGIASARDNWTWASSAARVAACLRELQESTPRRMLAARTLAARRYRQESAARDMAVAAIVPPLHGR